MTHTAHRIAPDDARVLLELLDDLTQHHERLFRLIVEKREALRTADIAAINRVCAEENSLVQRLLDLERRRVDVAKALGARLDPPVASATLAALAAATEETVGTKLVERGEALRTLATAVRRESAVVTAAASTLSRHLTGIVLSVYGTLSRAGVYQRHGRITAPAQLEGCVDIKS